MIKSILNINSKALLLTVCCFVSGQIFAQRQTVSNPLDIGANSIRDVIANANPGDTIDFSPIIIAPIILNNGVLNIDKALVFEGNGTTTISGMGANTQLFNIIDADSVHFVNMTLTSGNSAVNGGAIESMATNITLKGVEINGSTASGDGPKEGGGAVYINGANLRIGMNSILDGNTADGVSGSGGAILLDNGANLIIMNSELSNNVASRAGGAIESNTGGNTLINIFKTTFNGNETGAMPGNGGALHITGMGDAVIDSSTFTANIAAAEGGALWNGAGNMTVSASNFSNNAANGDASSNGGGALFNLRGILTLNNGSILENNSALGASGSGGAIFNDSLATLVVENSTIRFNQANRAGGGIEDQSLGLTTVTLNNVVLDSNEVFTSPGNGGGFHITGNGNAEITGGTANGNIAGAEGGAFWNGAGTMIIDGTMINGNESRGLMSDQGGAGIYNLRGNLIIMNAQITNNFADSASASGGGILNDAGATLTVNNTRIQNNRARRAGGGIEDNSGASTIVTLTNVNLDSNIAAMAPGNGGGLHVTGAGIVSITGGTVSGNLASAEGGGLWNGSGIMTINGTSIRGNESRGKDADQGGAGIYNLSGNLEIMNSIISNNFADSALASGGGILNDAGATLLVSNSVIKSNRARRAGGGIEDNSGASTTVTLNNVNLDSNIVAPMPGNGGGLHVTGAGNIEINGGSVNGNIAFAEGGGLWNGSGSMFVNSTLIDGNESRGKEANQGGAGVYNLSGDLTLNDVTLSSNFADSASASGGAILNDVGASLTIFNSRFRNNRAKRAGGAIEDVSGNSTTTIIANATFIGNTVGNAPGNGGAIHITGNGNMAIEASTFNNNTASAEGGALWNGSGNMNVGSTNFNANTASGNDPDQGGGAIYNLSGVLTLNNSNFANNNANGTSGSGGAILNDIGATLLIDTASFEGNISNRAGGAIEDNSRSATLVSISNAVFTNNLTGSAPGNGGAIHITGNGIMTIENAVASDNTASNEGGAFWNGSGAMQINRVRFENNISNGVNSEDGGGAIFNNGGLLSLQNSSLSGNQAAGNNGSGGALANVGGRVQVFNSTLSGNIANNTGGAIYNRGSLTLENSTVVLNEAKIDGGAFYQANPSDSSSVSESLLALNIAPIGTNFSADSGFTISGDYNLIGADDKNQFPSANNDQVGTVASPINPMLLTLQNNGGFTLTHSFLDGSPALNRANPNNQDLDQLGQAVFGGRKDVGAFECQTCSAVGINEAGKTSAIATVFPNPSFGNNLKIEAIGNNNISVVLIDNSGKRIASSSGNTSLNIDTSNLNRGTYILKITSNHVTQVSRVVKM